MAAYLANLSKVSPMLAANLTKNGNILYSISFIFIFFLIGFFIYAYGVVIVN